MTDRKPGERPQGLVPPKLPPSPPVPQPGETDWKPEDDEGRLDPVRYGDWERKGIAVDF
ncbi:DUF1674 domain-containing protein [Sphingomonas sp. ID0503]|uniref:DUF1674 domain-containing protein n=1 Tax=Sphingomonas sp. ID0503 TaxID=3399691 RepID=UPI003AFA6D3B